MTTSRRLATDAKLVLEQAGYTAGLHQTGFRGDFVEFLHVWGNRLPDTRGLLIISGTVDNAEVERLLEAAKNERV